MWRSAQIFTEQAAWGAPAPPPSLACPSTSGNAVSQPALAGAEGASSDAEAYTRVCALLLLLPAALDQLTKH